MPLIETKGAASAQGFGEFAASSGAVNYIENVFSTYLYTGNSSTQTITNGIDLAGKGGLVWMKDRSAVRSHCLADTANGAYYNLFSDLTNGLSGPDYQRLTSFNSDGFSIGSAGLVNNSGGTYASWTFREQPKFFDIVTYTGSGGTQAIAHNLGSVPGCIIIKARNSTEDWNVYHRSTGATTVTFLNLTNAAAYNANFFPTAPTSTEFYVGDTAYQNAEGSPYIAYIFAHNAGGFGLTGTDNVISCGSFSLNSAVGVDVNLGYEAQWVMIKRTDSSAGSSGWYLLDTMRGWTVGEVFGDKYLVANTSAAEAGQSIGNPTATGFSIQASTWLSTGDYIYIAIRRGPMKVPTSGTSVFIANTATGNGVSNTLTTNFPVDLSIDKPTTSLGNPWWVDRLRGSTSYISSATTNAEASAPSNPIKLDSNTTVVDVNWGSTTKSYVDWAFRRAPSFFDEVCYTGTGTSTRYITHGLSATPELAIVKKRSSTGNWVTTCLTTGGTSRFMCLNTSNPSDVNVSGADGFINLASSSAYDFLVRDNGGNIADVNASSATYVAYLFATCAGVSKVFAYTGNGSSRTINCGFTSGARFVMIKRVDSAGDWYVWDSARGIVAGNDPHLSLNDTAAEVTTDDSVDTDSTGFTVNQVAATNINVNYADYIGLAIA